MSSTLLQVGAINSFLQGIYDSEITLGSLAKKGDFGLGTINAVDGELVILDGVFYRIDAKGKAEVLKPDTCTPFTVISQFKAEQSFVLDNIPSFEKLEEILEKQYFSTPNIFYSIRIDGFFETISVRSEKCQTKSYRPLAETLPNLQTVFTLKKSKGTLVGVYCPQYTKGVCIPGFHFHYIDDKKTTGGHVFELELTEAKVAISPSRDFQMHLFHSHEFDAMKLNFDMIDSVTKVEKL